MGLLTRSKLRAMAAFTLAFMGLVLAPASAHAASLASVRTGSLPALPAGQVVEAIAVVEGRPVALAGPTTWLLDSDEKAWSQVRWRPMDSVVATATGPHAAWLLTGPGGQAQQVEQLSLANGALASRRLPPLPLSLFEARATQMEGLLYIAGLGPNGAPTLLRLDARVPQPIWQALPGWPAAGSHLRTLVGQTGALFAVLSTSGATDRQWRWSAQTGWQERGAVPGKVVGDAARATGQAHLLYLIQPELPATPRLMTFQTVTDSWATLVDAPGAPVRASAPWRNGLLMDRANAGEPTSALGFAEIESGKVLLRWLDWIVIGLYLGSMLGMGLYFYLREKRNSTADFFVGGRSIPFWAAGVSLYVANTSSISYIAIPAKAFETNWQYMTNNLIAVLGLMFVAVWIVPLLRRLDLMSVFSYLETRFHPWIRMLASALCIAVQIGSRMSIVLFLPSLAIATITGIDVIWSVLLMGGFTIVYTAMGGMKAVIWTDFVQLFVKMGGAIFAIGFMIYALKGGFAEFLAVAAAENKTRLFDFSFDLTKATVWGFVFLVLFDVVLTFPKDQVLMQRTLSTKSAKEAGRSIWALAAIMIPGGIVFYTIGTALFVYYKANPERMNPLLSIDATFPLFIAAELPMGITGLIIAGIFAAAMATLSSIMNSVATLASVDFYEKLVSKPDPEKSVRFAEWMTVAAGLLGIGGALVLSRFDIHSLFDVSIELAGLLGGGFAGAYTLGMFTRRANSAGVAIGVASSIVLTTFAWTQNLVHPYFYLAISILLCIVIGYIASLFFPAPTRRLDGLTIYADADPDLERPTARQGMA